MKNNNRSRLVPLLCLLSAALLLLSSCGKSPVPNGMYCASPASATFNLYVPKSWVDNSASGTASAYYSAEDRSNVSMTVMIREVGMDTLDEYIAAAEKNLSSVLPEYEHVVPAAVDSSAVGSSAVGSSAGITDTRIAGLTAKSFSYTAKLDGILYRFRQSVTVKGQNFYIFTYTSTDALFESHLEDVDRMLAEITFR